MFSLVFFHRTAATKWSLIAAGLLSLLLSFHLSSIAAMTGEESIDFLIQDRWGNILGIEVSPDGKSAEPFMVRELMTSNLGLGILDLEAEPEGGYQLAANGEIIPVGNAKLSFRAGPFLEETFGFAMVPGGKGGWIALENMLKMAGRPPKMVFPPFDRPISDVEYDPMRRRLTVLFIDGGIAICGPESFTQIETLRLEDDRAIDVESSDESFFVLTKKSIVYEVNSIEARPYPSAPDLSGNLGKNAGGLACDIELSPFGKGLYVLDIFGCLHACGGAPEIPTEPLKSPVAVDLEIISTKSKPSWYPPGWNTKVELLPQEITLDPEGPAKTLSLHIQSAERMSGFSAELHYDPELLIIAERIEVGKWWKEKARDTKALASRERGIATLKGGGTFFLYEGASGSGELIKLSARAASGATSATTVIQLPLFHFRDSSLRNQLQVARTVSSATVYIRSSSPQIQAVWNQKNSWMQDTVIRTKPGEILQADLLVEEGGRIVDVDFGFQFPTTELRFLGMAPGGVWSKEEAVWPDFAIPSKANQEGALTGQRIKADRAGACKDQRGALVILFFSVRSRGEGSITFDTIQIHDEKGQPLAFEQNNLVLHFESR